MTSPAAPELVERIAALPPAAAAAANVFGYPLSDVSSFVMIVYGLLLIGWHIWSKWLGKGGKEASE
jgi:hypothetical protein